MARSIKDGISSAFSDDPNRDFFERMSAGNTDDDDSDTGGGGSDPIPRPNTAMRSDNTRVAKQYQSSDELMKIARGKYRKDLLRLFGSVKKDPDQHHTLEMEAGKKLKISGDDVSVLNPDGSVATQGSFDSFEKLLMEGDSGKGQQQGGAVSMAGDAGRSAGSGGNNQGGGGRMMGGDSSSKSALSPEDMPRGVDRSESARSMNMDLVHSMAKRAVQEGRGDDEMRKQQARKAQLLKDLPRLKPGTDAHYIAEQGIKDADMTIEIIGAQQKEILQSQRKR